MSFSPDNSKLYISNGIDIDPSPSVVRRISVIYQLDFNAGTPAQIAASKQLINTDSAFTKITDMQIGLDGKLYFVALPQPDSFNFIFPPIRHLGSIECPNALGSACDVRYNSVYLGGRESGWYLPTQDQTIFRNADHVQAAADPPVICGGDSSQLVAYGGGATTVRWFPSTGLSSDTTRNPWASPTVSTTYTVIAQRACGPPDTARLRVVVTPGARVVEAGPDTTVCAGATVQLGGPAPDPTAAYLWGPTRYLSAARAARPVFTAPFVARDTVFTYIVRAYCTALPPDTVRIGVRALPVLTPVPTLTGCPADRLRLGTPPLPGAAYQWEPATLLTGATTAQPTFLVPAPPHNDTVYVFRRTLTAAGGLCPVTDSVRVLVPGRPTPPELLALSVDTTDERRLRVALRVARPADFPGAAPLTLESQQPGQPFGAGQSLTLPPTGAETEQPVAAVPGAAYRVRGAAACDTLFSIVHRPVTLRAEPTDSLGGGRLAWSAYRGWGSAVTYTVLAQPDGAAGFAPRWSGADTALVVPPTPGPSTRYRIRASAADGRRSESNTVALEARPGLRAYNVITPNADGRNDAFVVDYLDYYPGAALTVYSRWGERVYEAPVYQSGQWQAEGLAAGLYYYLLRLPDGRSWRGWVEVIR